MQVRDIGFGNKVNRKSNRLILPDGSYNVIRKNTSFDLYYHLTTCHYTHFIAYIGIYYVLFNAVFALFYTINGVENLAGIVPKSIIENLLKAYFFSVQTFTTVGYGYVHPIGVAANVFASIEALIGILSVSVVSGVLYGRFTQRGNSIIYSKNAMLTKLNDKLTFQFRIANCKDSELIEMEAKVFYSAFEQANGERKRIYRPVKLELSNLVLFPLNWTLVHVIDEHSPFHNQTQEQLIENHAEVIALISGYDDTTKLMVYSKFSYAASDFIWNAKFVPAFTYSEHGETVFDLEDIGKYEMQDNNG